MIGWFRRLLIRLRTGTRFTRRYGVLTAERDLPHGGTASMGVPMFRPVPNSARGSVRVKFSEDGTLFYLPDYCTVEGFWLSVETLPVPSEPYRGVFDGLLRIEKNDGTRYARRYLPFRFWSIRPGRQEWMPMKTEMVLDYLVQQAGAQEELTRKFRDFCEGRR